MALTVGDVLTFGDRKVEVVAVTPDANGEIPVLITDSTGDPYYSMVPADKLEVVRSTFRADTPHGQVTIELPVDGVQEVRAVWSKTAADALRG